MSKDKPSCDCEKCKQYEIIWLCPSCELGLLWVAVGAALGWIGWENSGGIRLVASLGLSFAMFRCFTVFRSHPHH